MFFRFLKVFISTELEGTDEVQCFTPVIMPLTPQRSSMGELETGAKGAQGAGERLESGVPQTLPFSQVQCIIKMRLWGGLAEATPIPVMGLHLLSTRLSSLSRSSCPTGVCWADPHHVLPSPHSLLLNPFLMGCLLKIQEGELWSQVT